MTTTCFVLCPPKVAKKLVANLSTSSGAHRRGSVVLAPTPTWEADWRLHPLRLLLMATEQRREQQN